MCQPASENGTPDVGYSAGTCSYQVTWQPMPSWYSRMLAVLFRKDDGVSTAGRKIEAKIPVTVSELEVEGIMTKINGLAHCGTGKDGT
jgi:hypothetical protein